MKGVCTSEHWNLKRHSSASLTSSSPSSSFTNILFTGEWNNWWIGLNNLGSFLLWAIFNEALMARSSFGKFLVFKLMPAWLVLLRLEWRQKIIDDVKKGALELETCWITLFWQSFSTTHVCPLLLSFIWQILCKKHHLYKQFKRRKRRKITRGDLGGHMIKVEATHTGIHVILFVVLCHTLFTTSRFSENDQFFWSLHTTTQLCLSLRLVFH